MSAPCTKTALPHKIITLLTKAKDPKKDQISLKDFLTVFFEEYSKHIKNRAPRKGRNLVLNTDLYLYRLSKIPDETGCVWSRNIGNFCISESLGKLFDLAHSAGQMLSNAKNPNNIVNLSRITYLSILKGLNWFREGRILLENISYEFTLVNAYFRSTAQQIDFERLNNADIFLGDAPLFNQLLFDEQWIELAAFCEYMSIRSETMQAILHNGYETCKGTLSIPRLFQKSIRNKPSEIIAVIKIFGLVPSKVSHLLSP